MPPGKRGRCYGVDELTQTDGQLAAGTEGKGAVEHDSRGQGSGPCVAGSAVLLVEKCWGDSSGPYKHDEMVQRELEVTM